MERDRWTRITELFDAALDRDERERTAWLRGACDDDTAVYDEVTAMLEAHEEATGFLEEPAVTLVGELKTRPWPTSVLEQVQRVGPYRLLHRIGHGGTSTVFLAERADGTFDRRVAVKLLHPGLDASRLARQFAQEQQVLAALNHPHIARLYDGGVTEGGSSYLVMELVEGRPIDRYCDEERLTVEERLDLFAEVCEAVQYAHRNLVVHRDLKPSNILVTADGQVKLLDFGIAKLLREERAAAPAHTRTEERWMTPEYAAPEQVRGEPISTMTDVYALGVLLYTLLTGKRPLCFGGRSAVEVERVVCEETPPAPSQALGEGCDEADVAALCDARRTDPVRLRRRLRGDLDTIVLKALRKEPERRYASVETLAEDLRRHLGGLPVRARPDTLRYRTRKFVQRHRWGLSVSGAAVVLLVAFVSFYALRITAERDRSRAEAAKAAQVARFMTTLLGDFDPNRSQGGVISADAVLERAVRRVQAELGDQPAVQAQLYDELGRTYQSYARFDRAEELLSQALALRTRLFGETHPDAATTTHNLAWLYYVRGDYPAADSLYQRALEIRRILYEPPHPDLAASLIGLGLVHRVRGELEQAEARIREALVMRRSLEDPVPTQLAETANALAYVLYNLGKYAEADSLHREAITLRRAALGTHIHTAQSLHDYATLLTARRDFDEAERYYREALAMRRMLLNDDHPHVAQSLSHLGWLNQHRGRYAEAESLYQEALEARRQRLGDGHLSVANSHNMLGQVLVLQGRQEEGLAHLQTALQRYLDLLGEAHPSTLRARMRLAELLGGAARYGEAEALLLEVLETTNAADGRFTAEALQQLAALYDAWQRPGEADRYRQALAALERGTDAPAR